MACFAAFLNAHEIARRMLAQGMTRELGHQSVHVACVVVDGVMDTQFIRSQFLERYALKADDGILSLENIAQNYVMLHRYPCGAWAHELALRLGCKRFWRLV